MARKRTNGTGEKRATRARSRSAGGGIGKAAVSGLLVAGSLVLIYLAYNHYQNVEARNAEIREHNKKVQEHNLALRNTYEIQQGKKYVKDRNGSISEKKELAKAPPPPPAPGKPVAELSDEFKSLRTKANALFDEAQFKQAADVFAEAATQPAPKESISKINEASEACKVFAAITSDVKTSVEATVDGLYIIKLKGSGAQIRAKVVNQNDSMVWYIKDKIRGQLPKQNIDSMVPVKQEDRDRQMRQKFEDIRANAIAEKDPLAYYLAAVKALEFNFRKDAARLLKDAWDLDKERGRNLHETVREYWAVRMFRIGAWYYSVGIPKRGEKKFNELIAAYPGTHAAEEAAKTMAELQRQQELVFINQQRIKAMREAEAKQRRESELSAKEETTRKEKERSLAEEGKDLLDLAQDGDNDVSGKDAATIREANAAFKEGVQEYNQGMTVERARSSNKHYKKAITLLTKAVTLYTKALKSDPNNENLKNRAQNAQTKLYWSKKSLRCGM